VEPAPASNADAMDIDYDAFGAPYDEFADLNMGEEKKTRRITLDLRKVDYEQTSDAFLAEVVALANSRTSEYGVEILPLLTNDSNQRTRHDTHFMATNKARILEQAEC
jgi:hypothetical protein